MTEPTPYPTPKLQMLLVPVAALDPALTFWQNACGLTLKFRDGERYAALDGGGFTLALCAGDERIVDAPAPVLRVNGIELVLERLRAAGAEVLRALEPGPHECRAVLRAPDGSVLVLSEKIRGETT